jgi:hypothetical protein
MHTTKFPAVAASAPPKRKTLNRDLRQNRLDALAKEDRIWGNRQHKEGGAHSARTASLSAAAWEIPVNSFAARFLHARVQDGVSASWSGFSTPRWSISKRTNDKAGNNANAGPNRKGYNIAMWSVTARKDNHKRKT